MRRHGGGGDGGDLVEGVPGSSAATPAVTGAPEIELTASAVSTIATGFRIPWGLAFLPDGTALVTERGNEVLARDDPGGVARIMSVTADGTVTEVQRLSEVDLQVGRGRPARHRGLAEIHHRQVGVRLLQCRR